MSTTAANRASMPTDQIDSSDSHSTNGKLGEADFLTQEAERAKAAITESLAAIGRSLGRAADPHRLTQDHPYIAVGVAAVAGFAAAASLVPSKQQQTFKTLAAIERSLRKPAESKEEAASGKKSGSPVSGFLGIIVAEVFKLLRPLLTTLVTGAVSGGNTSPEHDGATGDDASSTEAPGIPSPS